MKTVLITGCSSGFGLDAARTFLDRGWNVIATMRTPNADLLPASPHLSILALDVTDAASIQRVVEAAGPVDVLVNNAGIGLLGPVEGAPMDSVRDIYETNTLGTIAMTQAFIPQFRERGDGVIVNVTSTVTLRPLPLLAVYTGSKAAVNAYSESLALELEPLGVRVRIVLPGLAPDTSFGTNARPRMGYAFDEAYTPMVEGVFARFGEKGPITTVSAVSEAIWFAANDAGSPMRIPAGDDAVALAAEVA